jgi:lauroyl/myristoyl acyltransferase
MTVETKPEQKKTLLQRLKPDVVSLFKFGMRVAPLLPVRLGNALADLIGIIGFYLIKSKREAAMSNLAQVFYDRTLAERRKIGRGIFKSNMRNYYDMLRVHALSPEELQEQVKIYGLEDWYKVEHEGRGVICYAAHMGSFSFVVNMAQYAKLKFNLVVENIKPPELFELFRQQRENFPDSKIIQIGSPEIRNILRALKRGEWVCLAIDRDVIGTGKPIKFFGKETKLPFGAAELAIKTNSYVMLAHPYRRPDGTSIVQFSKLVLPERTGDAQADTQKLMEYMVGEIEKVVRTTPQDWVVLAPIWTSNESK